MPSVNAVAVANGPAESPEAVAAAPIPPSPSPTAAATKGRGLRRWRRIRRDSTGGGGEGHAYLHKRSLPLAAAGAPRGKHDASPAAAEAESSAASVESRLVAPPASPGSGLGFSFGAESGLCSSNAWNARQLGHCRGDVSSVVGRSIRLSGGTDDNGRMHSCAHLWSEPILMLQRAQEALENELEKITAIGKEPSDDFDVSDYEWTGSVHLEEPNENLVVRIKHLESRLQETSALLKEKASRIYELEAIRARKQPGKTTRESTNLLLSQCELDQLYHDRLESEIQCIVLTRAYQASATLAEDQMILYQTQKSLSEDYKRLGLRLRNTESRATMLEEMAEKLQLQCKELSNSSEVLQLRYKASSVSLFCFVQFLLLCIAMGTYLMRLSPSSTKRNPCVNMPVKVPL